MPDDRIMRRNNEYNPNDYHDPHEWPVGGALLISSDVLSMLLSAAASFYRYAAQARAEHRAWALTEHELRALRVAIDTAARELGVEEQPLYKDSVRRQ